MSCRRVVISALLLVFPVVLAACDGTSGTTLQGREQATGQTTPSLGADEEVVVQDPYDAEGADAPNYFLPESITVAPGVNLASAPASVPAKRIVMDKPPDTDLNLKPSPADPTRLLWFSPDDALEVSLGSQQVAIEQATSYLKEHGLWLDEWGEPTVSVGPGG
ncbi:MAG: hypothetical protein M1274_14740, partial [Actinobacteria bacterium]|nr:hypothetical protein [Actinomycetota bacterium]